MGLIGLGVFGTFTLWARGPEGQPRPYATGRLARRCGAWDSDGLRDLAQGPLGVQVLEWPGLLYHSANCSKSCDDFVTDSRRRCPNSGAAALRMNWSGAKHGGDWSM